MKKNIIFVTAIIVLSIFIVSCTLSNNAALPAQVPAAASSAPAIVEDSSSTRDFQIAVRAGQFTPSTISVTKGDKVHLLITSEDSNSGFALPKFGVNERIVQGQTAEVNFVADHTGAFPYTCGEYCLEGQSGLVGTLNVR